MALVLLPLYFLGSNISDPTDKALISNDELQIERAFVIDKSAHLSVADVRGQPMQATPATKIPWSFEQQAYWIKITLANHSDKEKALVMHFANPMLNQLTLYHYQQESLLQQRQLSWREQHLSLINRSMLNFAFTLPAHTQTQIYSRIETLGIAKTPINIYFQEDFLPLIRSTYLIWGAFIGILCMISLYNLVLFYGLKERVFLVYIGYILSTLTMMSIVEGFGHYLFPARLYQLLRVNVISLNYAVLIFAVLFALFFLNFHKAREAIYHRSIYYVYLLIFLSVISIFLGENLAAPLFFVAMGTAYLLCFVLLYKSYNIDHSWGVLYIVSWIPLLIGGAIQPLELTDVIPYSFITRHVYAVCILFEITLMAMALSERVRQQKEISLYNATHDLETGLPGYKILEECLQDEIQAQTPLTLCLVSVTGLNRLSPYLNDQQGVTLLQHFLHSARSYVEPLADFMTLETSAIKQLKIARVRDNVFALLLQSHQTHEEVIAQIKPLSNSINDVLKMSDISINLKTSIGFYRINGQHLSASAVLKKAFQALETGVRDDLAISGYDDQRHYSLTLASELQEALLNDELMLYHQPQINLQAASVHGSEGLLRWKHKQQGFIPVESFIALAEDTGLINQVSLWVINRACQDVRALMALGYVDHQVSVNMSGSDVVDRDFLSNVAAILEKWNVPPKLLNLELTESVMISDYSSVEHVLEGLLAMGISVSIDDFGTGYSSLSHILELPFNELKIDRVFVTEMETNQRNCDIVKTTIEMARILDLRVVAEGIETEAVANRLLSYHCDLAQGYYYSKPLPFSEYLNWLEEYSATAKNSAADGLLANDIKPANLSQAAK
ncbi:MAG: EAL domain-containing protein [Oceanospirillaceae bacterium]